MICGLMRCATVVLGLVAACESFASDNRPGQSVIVVVGAPGTNEYSDAFDEWATAWREAATKGNADFTLIGRDAGNATPGDAKATTSDDRTRLKQFLEKRAEQLTESESLWLVLIGHGSFDGEVAKFNLRGPDVSLKELAKWLEPIRSTVAVIDCSSASAPLLGAASGSNRIVVTATKSGHELNYARFGQYLSSAISSRAADLDKDDQTSLLEAYLTACRGVAEFYESDARLATEHALLDDNGDGLGTPAAWFRGLRATKRAKEGASLDGLRAHQLHLVRSARESQLPADVRERRDEIERELAVLRDRKAEISDDAYYSQIELLLLEMAKLYADATIR